MFHMFIKVPNSKVIYLCTCRTTLMYAVRCGSELIISHLFQKGIDANKTDEVGWTAMRYAVQSKSKV